MPQYKLIYFDAKGRAELIRFIFAQAGVEYEDKRVTWEGVEWQQLKPNTPYGSLPVLEVDGKQLAESGVIVRYLAEEFGLAGSNAFENAEIASIVGVVDDMASKVLVFPFEDEARKANLKKSLEEEHLPKYLGILDKRASGNNCAAGWIYGPKVTYADLKILSTLDLVLSIFPSILDKYPAIAKLKASVEQLPNIVKWLKERPQTEY